MECFLHRLEQQSCLGDVMAQELCDLGMRVNLALRSICLKVSNDARCVFFDLLLDYDGASVRLLVTGA